MKFLLGLVLIYSALVAIQASSHGEAPLSATFPQTDGTDFYMFQSTDPARTGFTTFISNWNPRQLPQGGPNFYSWDEKFSIDISIDNTGLGEEDIKFSFIFNNELANLTLNISGFEMPVALKIISPQTGPTQNGGLNFQGYYRINYVTPAGTIAVNQTNNGATSWKIPFDNAGTKTIVNYTNYASQYIYPITIPGCSATGAQVFVGQRAESFSINLGKVFDLVNFVPIDGGPPSNFPQGITQNVSNNVLRGTNIGSIALEVPTSCLVGTGNGVIGAWTSATAINSTGNGKLRQKSRLANPLVNELFTGLVSKDRWNTLDPYSSSRLNHYLLYPTFPAILNALFLAPVNSLIGTSFTNLAPTSLPRKDLVAVFLTGIKGLNQLSNVATGPLQDLLRLNTKIAVTPPANQSSLGVIGGDDAGFPNGRRPGDDVIDIALRVVMGALCHQPTLGLCPASSAVVGTAAFTDGSPVSALNFANVFPYLNAPTPGSVDLPCSSIAC